MVVKNLKNLKKLQKNHKSDLQRLRIVLYYNSVAPEKESDEVDKSSALGHAIKKVEFEKNQKIFKIRFASSKKRCYIMQPIFSGVLLKVPYG